MCVCAGDRLLSICSLSVRLPPLDRSLEMDEMCGRRWETERSRPWHTDKRQPPNYPILAYLDDKKNPIESEWAKANHLLSFFTRFYSFLLLAFQLCFFAQLVFGVFVVFLSCVASMPITDQWIQTNRQWGEMIIDDSKVSSKLPPSFLYLKKEKKSKRKQNKTILKGYLNISLAFYSY